MLTDILIASRDDATIILDEYPQRKDWSGLELKGLCNMKLAALLDTLGSPTEAAALEGEDCILVSRQDGPWVILLPIILRDTLAALPDSQFRSVAEQWANHEELVLDGWSAEDVEPGIGMLKTHAKVAVEAGKDLLLWMAL